MLGCLEAGIVAVDQNCGIFYANEMFAEQISVPVQQVIGRRIDEFIPATATKTCLATGEKIVLKEGAKGGRDAIIYPLKDHEGGTLGVMAMFFNVNSAKDTERYTHAIYEEVKDRYLFSDTEDDEEEWEVNDYKVDEDNMTADDVYERGQDEIWNYNDFEE